MRLLYSPASPYSAKTRMAAHYLGLGVEVVAVDTSNPPTILSQNNPLSKIPVLLLDNGKAVYDSVAIMHFLNRESGGRLYPADHQQATEADILEALCDGIMDSLLSIVYERRFRPEEMVHQPWIDKQWNKVESGLDYLERHIPQIDGDIHGGHFAFAAMLTYIELRFAGRWQSNRPNLIAWLASFEVAFPAYSAMKSGA